MVSRRKGESEKAFRKRNRDYMNAYNARREAEEPHVGSADPVEWPEDRAEAVAEYARRRLIVPTGIKAGGQYELLPWQIDFLRGIFAEDVSMACLSIGRKAGKTGLIAAVMLAALDRNGPLHKKFWRGCAISSSQKLADELRTSIEKTAEASGIPLKLRQRPPPMALLGAGKTTLQILASEKGGANAVSGDFIIIDEAGTLESRIKKDKQVWDTASTATAATDGLTLFIGTQNQEGDMFQTLLDSGDEVPGLYVVRFSAPEHMPLDSPETWRLANPSLGILASEKSYRTQSALALRDPVTEQGFRSLQLNQRVDGGLAPVVTLKQWTLCEQMTLPPKRGAVYVGIDWGSADSMTACALYWPETGRLEHVAAFPGQPDLETRERRDGQAGRYVKLIQAGELYLSGNYLVDVRDFLDRVRAKIGDSPIAAAGSDRWRVNEVREATKDTPAEFWPWIPRGTGRGQTADGTADLRAFQAAVWDREIMVLPSSIWPLAIAASRVKHVAGNPGLDKENRRARQDLVAAGIIAIGLATAFPDAAGLTLPPPNIDDDLEATQAELWET